MSFYVYAALAHPQFGITDLALVGEYDLEETANEVYDCENLAWSDEGILYHISNDRIIPNAEYQELIERVSK